MRKGKEILLGALGFVLVVGVILAFFGGKEDALDRIRAEGKITVLTRNNAHCYYIYREKPLGFEFELAQAFSDYLDVELEVMTASWEGLIHALDAGKGDFIAASLSITPSRERRVDFSDEYLPVQQRVVLHTSNNRVTELRDLEGKTVHVRRGTSYEERLRELQNEGLKVKIKNYRDTPTEELIEMVIKGEIEVTVADSNIALLNRRYYPDMKIAFPIGEPQSLGWAVRKGETALCEAINRFFKKIREDGTFQKIYDRYYGLVEIFDYFDLKQYHKRLETRLPRYEKIIRSAAEKHGFDWRLIAAVVYQESHFDPKARSFTGVEGIMQLTEETAKELGVRDRRDPAQSITGGVKYLRKLYDLFEDARDPDRLLLALASYNVGRGHILDAQGIARSREQNPQSWAAVREILPLLRKPMYYKKTKYGYCRGTEPVRYVRRIRTYYDILRREALG